MAPQVMPPASGTGGYQTPPFEPRRHGPEHESQLSSHDERWVEVLSAPCHFPLSVFMATMKTLALHPERNSSVILRADPLLRPAEQGRLAKIDMDGDCDTGKRLGLELTAEVRVRLMPRQPRRDGKLDQRCLFFRSNSSDSDPSHEHMHEHEDEHSHEHEDASESPTRGQSSRKGEGRATHPSSSSKTASQARVKEEGLVFMIPQVTSAGEIPYYHPSVRKLAFRYLSIDDSASAPIKAHGQDKDEDGDEDGDEAEEERPVRGTISIAYLPFPEGIPDLPSSSKAPTAHPLSRLAKTQRSSPLAGKPTSAHDDTDAVSKSDGDSTSATTARAPDVPADTPAMVESDFGVPSSSGGSSSSSSAQIFAQLQARARAQPSSAIPTVPNQAQTRTQPTQAEERLYRTCLSLLERLYKHGYGQLVGYQKRRQHDVIVPKDNFQDLYLVLKDRHRHLDSRAPKAGATSNKLEDVKRHVWKDVAVAAFLMLLWKEMYPPRPRQINGDTPESTDDEREWDTWGRPEGGFVDLGCGNGLLVHVLTSEGYQGKGYELRSRRTWPLYPARTQESLVELPINPLDWFPQTIEEWNTSRWEGREACVIRDGVFLIGNHADELTPWLPLLSLLPSQPIPHLSLPCCLHTLDSSFDILHYTPPTPAHPHTPEGGLEPGLEPGVSRYKSYLLWLGWCGLMSGWKWEKEGLRIPSTKGWGIVARNRWTNSAEEDRQCRIWALEQVNAVRQRGAFRVREKEGKDH